MSTSEQEFDSMLSKVRSWPNKHHNEETLILIEGAKEMLDSPKILKSWRMLMCNHKMSFVLRPVVVTVFDIVHVQVMANRL